jgi:hypothetical protein
MTSLQGSRWTGSREIFAKKSPSLLVEDGEVEIG